MRGIVLRCLGVATLVAVACIPLQGETVAAATSPGFIPVGQETLVPFGWADFCQRYEGECPGRDLEPRDVTYSGDAMRIVRRVNSWVNKTIEPMSDLDHWGVIDRWDYPSDGRGDCEDYVLLKRRMLLEEGFPRQALLVTIVKDREGEGHAILTVKTSRGEYVLDNLNPSVRGWKETGYVFVKRQSQDNENRWMSIGAPTSAPLTVSR